MPPSGATPSRWRCRSELIDAARAAESDPSVGALVVTGGAHFCAGAVRSVLADTGRDPVEDGAYRNLETVYRAFTTIGEVAVPTIAAVRGAAVGAGLNLALATDLRIVSRTARLLPGFAQIGIHPGGGHFTLLNRVAGREAAAALGLFGEEVDGERAVALGLAWAAYDDERRARPRPRAGGAGGRGPRARPPHGGELPARDGAGWHAVGRRRRARAVTADVVAATPGGLDTGLRPRPGLDQALGTRAVLARRGLYNVSWARHPAYRRVGQ